MAPLHADEGSRSAAALGALAVGFGRTETMFACEQARISGDIMRIYRYALEQGVLLRPIGDVVYFMPRTWWMMPSGISWCG